MKLSKAQQEVMDKARKDIDIARQYDYPEWYRVTQTWCRKDAIEKNIANGQLKEYWEADRRGEVLTHCNSKTLEKLQALGLIEIIHDSKKDKSYYGIDTIKVLNY